MVYAFIRVITKILLPVVQFYIWIRNRHRKFPLNIHKTKGKMGVCIYQHDKYKFTHTKVTDQSMWMIHLNSLFQ